MAIRIDGEPIIPDIAGLTARVNDRLAGDDASAVRSAVEMLTRSGIDTPTVENILNYLRLVAEVPGDSPVHGINPAAIRNADRAVCECIRTALDVRLPGSGTPFHALAVWVRAVKRHAPIELFTTNYDLLIEEALEASGVPYFDGFVGSRQPSFDLEAVEEDDLPRRWVRLWKLHGSVNWQLRQDNQVVRASGPAVTGGTMIYPSHRKYMQSRRLPYLALLDRLRHFLRQPSAILVTTGFGFRDEHINEVIQQSLRSNSTAAVLALMYSNANEYPEAVMLAHEAPNLSFIARDQAIIGSRQGAWSSSDDTPTASQLGNFEVLGELLQELVGRAVEEGLGPSSKSASAAAGTT